ncbi:DUF6493 family protein [Rapidithrix thailandica]|uniref:DUF6493 family protein n=1 Tax=Rapidithrix thailandica TaxID=413964 RepID=A0AAW9SLE4_9BACT
MEEMTKQDQLIQLLKQKKFKGVLNFLKSLDKGERSTLSPYARKWYRKNTQWTNENGNWSRVGDWNQIQLMEVVLLACCSFTEFSKTNINRIAHNPYLEELLEWYCPGWLPEFITEHDGSGLTYEQFVEFIRKGWANAEEALIARLMFSSDIEVTEDDEVTVSIRNLTRFPETLQEHIWYLFQYESSINYSDRSIEVRASKTQETLNWKQTFKNLSEQGTLDRQRLLKESTLAFTRNFNKTLTGWFVDLLVYLEPSQEELLSLQTELNQSFYAPQTKPVNTVLKFYKKLVTVKGFQVESFLEGAALLIASETKSIVSSSLIILEKIAKKYPEYQKEICPLMAQVFMHQDEALQKKATKFILQYGDPQDEALQEILNQYYESLLFGSKEALQGYFQQEGLGETMAAPEEEAASETAPLLTKENAICLPETFEDLLFLTSQALDGNESYLIDVLPAALIRLQPEVSEETIGKWEPAFQRAYKTVMKGVSNRVSYLDEMLAYFWVDFGQLLVEKYPAATSFISKIHEKNQKKEEESVKEWSHYTLKLTGLAKWKKAYSDPICQVFQHLLLTALAKLKKGDSLPVLSTPTHAPAWLSPVALVQRLAQYQEAEASPDSLDFQLAISRTAFEQQEEALQLAEEKLDGEWLSLMRFLLKAEESPQGPFTQTPVWMSAGLRKAPEKVFAEFEAFPEQQIPRLFLTGNYPWKANLFKHPTKEYDAKKKKYIDRIRTYTVLEVDWKSVKTENRNWLDENQKWLNGFGKAELPNDSSKVFLYSNLQFNPEYFYYEVNDIPRFLSLVPFHLDPVLAPLIDKYMSRDFYSEEAKTCVLNLLKGFLEYSNEFSPLTGLCVAAAMLGGDKTLRAMAAEVWIQGVETQKVPSELMGEILGKLENKEFAPLKRFTDLLTDNLHQVSSVHNQALEQLLTAFLSELTEEPLKGLKKLLEQYVEVVASNQSTITHPVLIQRLDQWKQVSSLKKAVQAAEKYFA